MNILQEIELEETNEIEAFTIDNLEKANWAFRKMAALNAKIAEKEELAAAEQERITNWLENGTKADKESIQFFEKLLTDYYITLRAEDPKARLTTPYGRVTSRKLQPKWEFEEEKAVKYFRENYPEIVKAVITETFSKADAKKLLSFTEDGIVVDEYGEIVEFARVTPQDCSYTVIAE